MLGDGVFQRTPVSETVIDHNAVEVEDAQSDSEEDWEVDQEYVSTHYDKIKALLIEHERKEALRSIRARLNFNTTPEGREGEGTSRIILEKEQDIPTFLETLQMTEELAKQSHKGKTPVANKGHHAEYHRVDSEINQPYRPSSQMERSKFTTKIASCTFPTILKMPAIVGRYDGTTDPEDHLFTFGNAAEVEQWSMPIWCHMFNQTLMGAARVWFDNLQPGGIEDFEMLKQTFLKHFSQQKRAIKDPTEIHSYRRRDEETIEDFTNRFVKESMMIPRATDMIRVSGYIHGVRSHRLVEKLHESLPTTMGELLDRVRAFIRGKDASDRMREVEKGRVPRRMNWRDTRVKPQGYEVKPIEMAPRKQINNSRPLFDRRPVQREGMREPFTILSKTPAEILATEKARNSFKAPHPLRYIHPNSEKFCEFHQEKGHHTNDCAHLKREIENAVKTGKLTHLIKEIKRGTGERPGQRMEERKRKDIMTLEEGTTSLMPYKKRKQQHEAGWAMQPISVGPISEQDAQEGSVVITAILHGHKIRRIYADTGASQEVMFEHCYKQLDPEVRAGLIVDPTLELRGFNGNSVTPMRRIQLSMIIGTTEAHRTITVMFNVVRGNSTYNIIIGRPVFRVLKGVVSVPHGQLKFPTPEGIATLHSSQKLVASVHALPEELQNEMDQRNGS